MEEKRPLRRRPEDHRLETMQLWLRFRWQALPDLREGGGKIFEVLTTMSYCDAALLLFRAA